MKDRDIKKRTTKDKGQVKEKQQPHSRNLKIACCAVCIINSFIRQMSKEVLKLLGLF